MKAFASFVEGNHDGGATGTGKDREMTYRRDPLTAVA